MHFSAGRDFSTFKSIKKALLLQLFVETKLIAHQAMFKKIQKAYLFLIVVDGFDSMMPAKLKSVDI